MRLVSTGFSSLLLLTLTFGLTGPAQGTPFLVIEESSWEGATDRAALECSATLHEPDRVRAIVIRVDVPDVNGSLGRLLLDQTIEGACLFQEDCESSSPRIALVFSKPASPASDPGHWPLGTLRCNLPIHREDEPVFTAEAVTSEGELVELPVSYVRLSSRARIVPTGSCPLLVYPNPSVGSVELHYNVDGRSEVSLSIFDTHGRRVKGLVSGIRESGNHQVIWNGRDDAGRNAATGVYFSRLRSRSGTTTQRFVFMHQGRGQ